MGDEAMTMKASAIRMLIAARAGFRAMIQHALNEEVK